MKLMQRTYDWTMAASILVSKANNSESKFLDPLSVFADMKTVLGVMRKGEEIVSNA